MYMGPGVYKHYKGARYKVLGLSTNTETEEVCVTYHAVERPMILYHRPIESFNQWVTIGHGSEQETVSRFIKEGL